MIMNPAETSELIDIPFWTRTGVGPRNHVLDGVQIPMWSGNSEATRGWQRTCSDMAGGQYTQSNWAGGQHRYLHRCWLMRTRFGCKLAPPGEYDWTVHVRRRCSLMSNYYDYLLISSFRHTIWQRDTSNTRCLMFEPLSHLQPLSYLQK